MILFWILVAAAALGVGLYLAAPLLKQRAWVRAGVAGAAAPLFAVIVYVLVGQPTLSGLAPAALVDPERRQLDSIMAMIEERLAEAPNDAGAWRRLLQTQLAADDYPGAARTLRRLIEIEPEDTSLASGYGEALVMSRGGVVSEEARAAFETAHAADPSDVRAAFYLAEAKYQSGRPDEAMAEWGRLAVRGTNQPWLGTVARRLQRAAQMQERSMDSLGLPAETMAAMEAVLSGAAPRRGPTDEQMAAAENMDPQARAQMIENMVTGLASRLEENPDDLEGWRMLANSYRQLGRDEDSLQAYRQVLRLAPDDLQALRDVAYGAWLAGSDDGPPTAETAALLEQLLARDEHDPVAKIGLAEAARAAGDEPRAQELLTSLAEDELAPAVLRDEARRQLLDPPPAGEPPIQPPPVEAPAETPAETSPP